MADSVGEALPREMTRVRNLLPDYYEVAKIAPMTKVTIAMMEASLDRAQTALAEGDVIAILRAYEDLKGYES
jgi:molybdopterin converting factor small subunit